MCVALTVTAFDSFFIGQAVPVKVRFGRLQASLHWQAHVG
jgi:hypothetical protein